MPQAASQYHDSTFVPAIATDVDAVAARIAEFMTPLLVPTNVSASPTAMCSATCMPCVATIPIDSFPVVHGTCPTVFARVCAHAYAHIHIADCECHRRSHCCDVLGHNYIVLAEVFVS